MELITIAVVVIYCTTKCVATLLIHTPVTQDPRLREMADPDFFVNVIRRDISIVSKKVDNLQHPNSPSMCNDLQKQMAFHSDLLKLLNMRVTRLIRFLLKDEKFEDTCIVEPSSETTSPPPHHLGSLIAKKFMGIQRRINSDNSMDPIENQLPNVINKELEDKPESETREADENLETTTIPFPPRRSLPQNPFPAMFKARAPLNQNMLDSPNELGATDKKRKRQTLVPTTNINKRYTYQ